MQRKSFKYISLSKQWNTVNMVVNVSLAEGTNLISWLLCNKLLSLAYLSVDLWYYFTQYDDDFSTCNNIQLPNCCKTFTARILLRFYHQNDTWCMMGSTRTASRVMIHLVGFMYVLWELDIRKRNKNDMKFIPFKQ